MWNILKREMSEIGGIQWKIPRILRMFEGVWVMNWNGTRSKKWGQFLWVPHAHTFELLKYWHHGMFSVSSSDGGPSPTHLKFDQTFWHFFPLTFIYSNKDIGMRSAAVYRQVIFVSDSNSLGNVQWQCNVCLTGLSGDKQVNGGSSYLRLRFRLIDVGISLIDFLLLVSSANSSAVRFTCTSWSTSSS